MMQDYDRTMELVNAANNSAGASEEQFGKTLDSLDAKLNGLSNAWQELTMTLANQEAVKSIVDILTTLLNIVNSFMVGASGVGEGWVSAINSIYNAILLVKNLSIILQPIFQKLIDSLMLMIKSSFNRLGREAGREFSNGLNSETKKTEPSGMVSAFKNVTTESSKFKQIIAGTVQGIKMLGKAGANSFKNFFNSIKNGATKTKDLRDNVEKAVEELNKAKNLSTSEGSGNTEEGKANKIKAAEEELSNAKAALQDHDSDLSKISNTVRGLGASLSMVTAAFANLTEESSVFTSTLLSGLSPVVNQVGNLIGGIIDLGSSEMQAGMQALLAGQMTGQAINAALGAIGLVIQGIVMIVQAIFAVINASKEAAKAERERKREAAKELQEELDKKNEEIDKNEELYQSYRDIYEKYIETGEGKDELINSTIELMRAYGKEYDIVELLTGGYKEYADTLKEARKAELNSKIENLGDKSVQETAILKLNFKEEKKLTKNESALAALGISLDLKDLKEVQKNRERATELLEDDSTPEKIKEALTKYIEVTKDAAEMADEMSTETEDALTEIGKIELANFEETFGKEIDNANFEDIYNDLFGQILTKYASASGIDINDPELRNTVSEIVNSLIANSEYQDEFVIQETLKQFENFSDAEASYAENILNKVETLFGKEQLNNFIYNMPEYAKASRDGLEAYFESFSLEVQNQFDREILVDASVKIKTILETDFSEMDKTEIETFVDDFLNNSPILIDKTIKLDFLAGTGYTELKPYLEALLKGGNKLKFFEVMLNISKQGIKSIKEYKKIQDKDLELSEQTYNQAQAARAEYGQKYSNEGILKALYGKYATDYELMNASGTIAEIMKTDMSDYAPDPELLKLSNEELVEESRRLEEKIAQGYEAYFENTEKNSGYTRYEDIEAAAKEELEADKQHLKQINQVFKKTAEEMIDKREGAVKEEFEAQEEYYRKKKNVDQELLGMILEDADAMRAALKSYNDVLSYLAEIKIDVTDFEISVDKYKQLLKDIPELISVAGIGYANGMVQVNEEFVKIVNDKYDETKKKSEKDQKKILKNIEELEELGSKLGLTLEELNRYKSLVAQYNDFEIDAANREVDIQTAELEKQKEPIEEKIERLEEQKEKLEEQKALLESILNTYSYTYNQLQKINAAQRKRNQLEWEYNNLQNEGGNGTDRLKNLQKQIDTYKKEISNVTLSMQKNMGRIGEIQKQYSEFAGLVDYNDATGEIILSSDIYDANKTFGDQETVDKFNRYIEELQAAVDEREDNREQLRSIYDSINEIKNQVKENAANFYNRVMEALVDKYQKQIDQLTELNDSMNDYNQSVIDGIQKSIDKERQEKQNKDKEDSIAEKQRKISVLSRDTSGANALEIKKLQKEIEDDQENFLENLVDQKLTELQDQNELAYEQRQKQLEMMQENLDWQQKTGVLWNEVEDLIAQGMGTDGTLLKGSDLETILKSKDGFEGLNELDKANWMTEVNSGVADVYAYLNNGGSGSLFKDIDNAKNSINSALKSSLKPIASGVGDANENLEDYIDKIGGLTKKIGFLNDKIDALNKSIETLTAEYTLHRAQEIKTKIEGTHPGESGGVWVLPGINRTFSTEAEAQKYADKHGITQKPVAAYATGGLNTETGIAWLDGTPSKPELVLNATDTQNMLKIVEIMRDKKVLTGEKLTGQTQNYFSIAMNVEEIASDYDVDELTERMIEKINDIARSRNNTILI